MRRDPPAPVRISLELISSAHPAPSAEDVDILAAKIRSHGLLQPLVVVPASGDGGYTLVAGHLGLEACRRLGWETVPCVVLEPGKPGTGEEAAPAVKGCARA